MGWTYSGDPTSSDLDAVRFEIQDTNTNAQLLQDAEIKAVILSETATAAGAPATIAPPNIFLAAARCMEVLSVRFLAQADTQVGQLKVTSTKRALQYLKRATNLRVKAQGFTAPYAGGQSVSEKQNLLQDADAVLPAFTRREFDNPWTGEQDGYTTDDFGPPVI